MWIYIWLAVTAGALVIEFMTADLVSVWFVGGGLVAMTLTGVGLDWYFHVPAFIVVSLILMACFRKLVLKKLNKDVIKTNAETAVGKEYTLLSDVGFNLLGTVKINGVVWNAVAKDEETEIKAGVKVKILGIEGNKLIVEEVK